MQTLFEKIFVCVQALTKECDEAIKDSGVLTNKDCFAWNWDIIKATLKVVSP